MEGWQEGWVVSSWERPHLASSKKTWDLVLTAAGLDPSDNRSGPGSRLPSWVFRGALRLRWHLDFSLGHPDQRLQSHCVRVLTYRTVRVLFSAAEFVAICYTTIGNEHRSGPLKTGAEWDDAIKLSFSPHWSVLWQTSSNAVFPSLPFVKLLFMVHDPYWISVGQVARKEKELASSKDFPVQPK